MAEKEEAFAGLVQDPSAGGVPRPTVVHPGNPRSKGGLGCASLPPRGELRVVPEL